MKRVEKVDRFTISERKQSLCTELSDGNVLILSRFSINLYVIANNHLFIKGLESIS